MELTELQALWQQHDKKLSENTRINKEILRQILISKPEKRINREKIKAGMNLILPIIMISTILIPNIKYRFSIDFYIGILAFGGYFVFSYCWSVKYFILIKKVDFSNSITSLKIDVKQIEKYKIRFKKIDYILMLAGMTGIFLMCDFPMLSSRSILPLLFIVMVMAVSIFITFKYQIFEYHRKLDKEIAEIEKLEKD